MKIVSTDVAGLAVLRRELAAGHLVVVPTPRWYMVCASASNEAACTSIFAAKSRPPSKSLVLLVPDTSYLEDHFQISGALRKATALLASGHLALRLRWGSNPEERSRASAIQSRWCQFRTASSAIW